MTETSQFGLTLMQASQAQKHVTVNEALGRLDAVAQMRVGSISVTVPPVSPPDGEAYAVPGGGVNEWDDQDGKVAIYSNGGWVFMAPLLGWVAWVDDLGQRTVFDGEGWRAEAAAVASGGAATLQRVTEFDHTLAAGPSSSTSVQIENGEQVIGVTGRILTDFTGSGLTSWDIGVSGSANRYGNGMELSAGSWVRGLSGAPVTYWSDTTLLLTANGGDFTGGSIRLAIHSIKLEPPRST